MAGFDNVVSLVKMHALLYFAVGAGIDGEPGVSTKQWFDAWLSPHFRLSSDPEGIALKSNNGALLYRGRLATLPISEYGRQYYEDLYGMGTQVAGVVHAMGSEFKNALRTRIVPTLSAREVGTQVEAYFKAQQQRFGP